MKSDERRRPFVVLGDVVESRDLDDRAAFQEMLIDALDVANERFDGSIHNDFEPIKGVDEFGGVLFELWPIYEVIATVLNRIHPVTIRFGIAQGRIDVGEPGDPVAELDGPGFHAAGEALDRAARARLYVGVDTGRPVDGLLDGVVNALLLNREQLTARQVEVMRTYEREGTQEAAASELGVPQQTVSKTLQRADYRRTTTIRDRLRDAIANVYDVSADTNA